MKISLHITIPDDELHKRLAEEGTTLEQFKTEAHEGFREMLQADELCPGATLTIEITE